MKKLIHTNFGTICQMFGKPTFEKILITALLGLAFVSGHVTAQISTGSSKATHECLNHANSGPMISCDATEPTIISAKVIEPGYGNGDDIQAANIQAVYSNISSWSGLDYINGGSELQSGNTITKLVADKITLTGTPPYQIGGFSFTLKNSNPAVVSVRMRVRFYAADGPGGLPGTIITGFSFAPVAPAAGSATIFYATVAPFTVTTSTIWAGMTFDNSNGTTGATLAQMNNFGQLIFNPIDLGSSTDEFFVTNSAGNHFNNTPAGTTANFGGYPVANFGWEFRQASTIVSLGTDNSNPRHAGSTAQWTLALNLGIPTLTSANFALIQTGTVTGSTITSVTQVTPTQWTIAASVGSGEGTLGINLTNIAGMQTNFTNTLPYVGGVYTVISCVPPTISGHARYYNNPQTPLDGLKITLKQGGLPIGLPAYTDATGFYQVNGVSGGLYDLEISSASPGGAWQTWNGVNNTDYLLVSRHVANIAPLAVNPPVVKISASVLAPHPDITNADANAIRMAARYGWGTPTPYFDIPKWVFSGVTDALPINNFPVACGSATTLDIMGLCAGDVNGSYLPPSGYKTNAGTFHGMSLQVVNRGTLPITPEITFPVRAENDMEIGAITLMLDFDPSVMEITGVEMPENGGEALFFRVTKDEGRGTKDEGRGTNGVLHIGWMSLDPVRVTRGETVLIIHTRMTNMGMTNMGMTNMGMTNMGMTNMGMTNDELRIRFALNENPLCELADAEGNVIDGAKLAIADAGSRTQVSGLEMLSVYPNPVSEILNIEYMMEQDGSFSAELMSLTGVVVAKINKADNKAGLNKEAMNLSKIPNGSYLLRVYSADYTNSSKVIVNH